MQGIDCSIADLILGMILHGTTNRQISKWHNAALALTNDM